jgi:hypothetical protein
MAKRYHGKMKKDAAEARVMRDGDMINEDHSAIANLPQNVIMKEYKKPDYTDFDSIVNDTIGGIDRQIDEDVSQARKHRSRSKY